MRIRICTGKMEKVNANNYIVIETDCVKFTDYTIEFDDFHKKHYSLGVNNLRNREEISERLNQYGFIDLSLYDVKIS